MTVNVDSVAARYAEARAGYKLLDCLDAVIPHYVLTLDALVLESRELDAVSEYVLKSVRDGLLTPREIGGVLGLESQVLERAVVELWRQDFVDYAAVPGGRSLILTPRGQRATEGAESSRPVREDVFFSFDRVLWRPVGIDARRMIKPRELRALDCEEIRPRRQRRPDRDEVKPSDIDRVLRRVIPGHVERSVLVVHDVKRADRFFLEAHVLLYQSNDGRDTEVAIAIDGRVSPEHEAAIAELGGPEFLRVSVEQAPDASTDIEATLGSDEAERLRREAVSLDALAEARRLSSETAIERDAREEGAEIAGASSPEAPPAPVAPGDAAVALGPPTYDEYEVDTLQLRALFDDARKNAKDRLLIISPWVTGSVVNKRMIEDLRRLARRGVTIHIGYGLKDRRGERPRSDADKAAEAALFDLASKFADMTVAYLGDTHAKVLVYDATMIVGSFNWLSFQGAMGRTYRQERGYVVRRPRSVERSYEEHRARIEEVARGDEGRE